MSSLKKNNFINNFKLRNFFPFYIDKVNNKFFSTINKNNKYSITKSKMEKFINNLDKDEIEKFNESQSILDHDNIQSLLNQIIRKILAKTGNKKFDFFVSKGTSNYGHRQYIIEKNEYHDLKILGNRLADKRYIYSIEVDKNSCMYDLVEQIQIAFFVDEKNKTITGGFSLNVGQEKLLNSYEEIIQKFYLNSLFKIFIEKELYPFSVDNFFSIIDQDSYSEIDSNYKNSKNPSKLLNKSLESLKKEWKKLLKEKIFIKNNSFSKNKEYFENELFYAILNILLCCLIIYEELKKYFSSEKPELFLPLFKRVEYVKENDEQNSKQDFNELISLLKNRYFYFNKDRKYFKSFKTVEEAIEALIKFDQFENESFGKISTSFEITRNSDIPFIDEDGDIFMNSDELKVIYLLVFKPEILGMKSHSLDFLDYNNFLSNIKKINFDSQWDSVLDEIIDRTICEWNYDYISFVDENFSSLIIKNNNPIKVKSNIEHYYDVDPNKKIYDNYLWSFIYTKNLIWKLNEIEENSHIDKVEKPWKLRNYLNELERLRLDWHDSFYGIEQVKIIVKKIDKFYYFNSLIKLLKDKITKDDKLFGKSKERKNLAATFVSAAIFGLLDFFTTVFSILTVNPNNSKIPTVNIVFIALGSVFAFCLLSILLYKVLFPLFSKKKNKQYY